MRARALALIASLLIAVSGCSGDSAKEKFETAKLEELQKNYAHARKLYREIQEKHPKSEFAPKAAERLKVLEGK